jgi:hypothetical protein
VAYPEPDLDNLFTHHPPVGDQVERYETLRDKAKEFAALVVELVPNSPERSTAITKIREAVMFANAGIACNQNDGEPATVGHAPSRPRFPGDDE